MNRSDAVAAVLFLIALALGFVAVCLATDITPAGKWAISAGFVCVIAIWVWLGEPFNK